MAVAVPRLPPRALPVNGSGGGKILANGASAEKSGWLVRRPP